MQIYENLLDGSNDLKYFVESHHVFIWNKDWRICRIFCDTPIAFINLLDSFQCCFAPFSDNCIQSVALKIRIGVKYHKIFILNACCHGTLTRDQLIANLKEFTNTRLASNGKKSQPKSYFEGLSEYYIVRARNFGSIYQADNLGITKYRIEGILDNRTTPICRSLIQSGRVFELVGAKDKMREILKIRDLGKLKSEFPFLTSLQNAKDPIPPLHWRCRSWMEYEI